MAILKRPSKKDGKARYQVLVDVRKPETVWDEHAGEWKTGTKRKRYTLDTFTRRKDAEAAERRAKVAIENGTFEPKTKELPKVVSVRQAVETWLTGLSANEKPTANTIAQYRTVSNRYVLEALGDRPVAELTRPEVKATIREWQANGMGAQNQNRCLLVLRCALDECVEDGLIPANPATGIKLPSPKKRSDPPMWNPEQLRRFLAEAERDQLGVFWHFLALEGMRRSEGLGARWEDVTWNDDESAATLTVTQTVVADISDGGAALVQMRTKSGSSRRSISLTKSTMEALKRHRDRQQFDRKEANGMWQNHGLIVTNEIGQPIRPDSVRNRQRAMERDADVPTMTTHAMRHGAITRMLKAGVPIAIVSRKAGHADIGLTSNTYGHLVAEDQTIANDATEAFLNAPTKAVGEG